MSSHDITPPRRLRSIDDFPLAPHRGQTIMVLGILSLFMGGLVMGPIAWIMGRNDLAEMDAGRMDPSGRDNTNTGKICGMIATLLHGTGVAVGLFCCVGYMFFVGAMFAAVGTSASTMSAQANKAAIEARERQDRAIQEAQELHEKARREAQEAQEKAREAREKARRDKDKQLPPDNPVLDPIPDPKPPEVAPVPNALAQPPAPADVEGKTTVDLIPLLDLGKDVVKGKWVVVDGVLHCNDQNSFPRVQIPYEPPEEYDFIVVFSQPRVRRSVGMILPNPLGDNFFWEFGGTSRWFNLTSRPPRRVRPGQRFMANTAYTSVVEVRRDRIRCLLDGKEIVNHPTDFKDLTPDVFRKMPNPRVLGVSCDDPTVFHYVRVVEMSGPGKKAR